MKKKIFALCIAVLIAVLSLGVLAEGEYYRLQDLTEPSLLTEAENEEIMAKLDEISEKHGMDIAILTVDAVEEGLTVEEDATELYEYLEYGKDGVMLYISMEENDWYLLTSGFGITAITDAGIDYISEKFLSSLSDGDYAGAFRAYIKYTDEFIAQAKTGKPYDAGNMPKEPYSKGEYYRLQDLAEPSLLTEAENQEIMAKLDEVSEKHGMDIVIITVDKVEEGLTVEQDATEWYEYLEFGKDGVMLYISMEENDWYLLTSGFGITAITDEGIDYISEKFLPSLSDGDYAGAFRAYIKYTDEFIAQAKTGEPYDVGNMPKEPYSIGMSLVISIAIGFIIAFIITGMWKGQLKSVALKKRATDYMKPGSLNITDSRDFFLYRHIDRTEKAEKSDGGSSTHTSSSGNTYGGKGGKF